MIPWYSMPNTRGREVSNTLWVNFTSSSSSAVIRLSSGMSRWQPSPGISLAKELRVVPLTCACLETYIWYCIKQNKTTKPFDLTLNNFLEKFIFLILRFFFSCLSHTFSYRSFTFRYKVSPFLSESFNDL